jgi:hypothetical protein
MPFDPASVAALVASVRARTDDGQFTIASAATPYRKTTLGQGIPAAASLAPSSPATATLYTWTALYKRRRLSGSLVADSGYALLAQGLLAQQATDFMNAVDVKYPPIYLFGQLINPAP